MNSRSIGADARLANLQQPWTDGDLAAVLPVPQASANKYSRGKLTVIAGSKRYPGAACLASRASQRMGAGYTEVVTDPAARALVLGAAPSLVVRDFEDFSPAELSNMKHSDRRAVCIGPGFVAGDGPSDRLVLAVLSQAACPVLVDGGALDALGSKEALETLAKRREQGMPTIITPHAGEARRLHEAVCGNREECPDDAAELAVTLSATIGAIAVVKGPDTFVSASESAYPMREGTPALAKAGTGDVLAGMIAALLAQGVDPIGSSILGATLHARAGIAAAERLTEIAVTPEDVIDAIPDAIRTLA